jgi:ClpX C4-type zinc finger
VREDAIMSTATSERPHKREVALSLLEHSSIYVHLDPRRADVVVPPWFKKQPQLVLQVGRNMRVPILDLGLDQEGLTATLSFSRVPFFCIVPWPSVFAMVGEDGRGMVWPEDVPPEVARQTWGRTTVDDPAPAKPADAASRRESIGQAVESHSSNCSFCGKSRAEVTALVDGPSASICNECIDVCMEIVADEVNEENPSRPAEVDDRALCLTTKRRVSNVIGQEALDLVKQANELRAIVGDLDAALRRHEHDRARAERERIEREEQAARRADPESELLQPSPHPSKRLDQLSELVSNHSAGRDKAYRDWNKVFSRAVPSLIEQVGLETCPPRRPSRSSRSSRPAAAASLLCSFCGRSQQEVEHLIDGPSVNICDQCARRADETAKGQAVR